MGIVGISYHRPGRGQEQNFVGHPPPFLALGDGTVVERGMNPTHLIRFDDAMDVTPFHPCGSYCSLAAARKHRFRETIGHGALSMKIVGISTGTLQLKPTFLEGSPAHGGPFGLIRRIARDPGFTEPLPMWAWVIEAATERILVDTGGSPGTTGGVTRTRFDIAHDQSLVCELARLHLKPDDVDRVVLTHLHGDHVGGLAAFDPRRVWVAKAEWEPVARFPGRLMRFMTAPVPRGFAPRVFDFDGPPFLGFTASWPVTSDGSVIALPTPGHSPGHTSYLVRRPEGDVLLAGDVTYELPALEAQREQGFIANVEHHHDSLRRVLALVRAGVAYLPSHDPASPARL